MLELLRAELSNVEIADRLGISRATAAYHDSEILSKLGVGSRREAAAWRPERRVWGVGLLAGLMKWSPVEAAVRTSAAVAVTGGVATIVAIAVGLFVLQDREEKLGDPSAPGPFAVGTTTRSSTWTLPDGGERTVEYEVWYPTNVGVPGPPFANAASNFPLVATPNAPIAAEVTRPLIVFSTPLFTQVAYTSYLLTHWASHGFIVAAPIHPDCAFADMPGCPSDDSIRFRPRDVVSVADDLIARSFADDPLFAGAVDPSRFGVTGYSLGGSAALRSIELDRRIIAAFVMAPIIWEAAPVDLTNPVMFLQGEWEELLQPLHPLHGSWGYFQKLPVTTQRWFVDIHRATWLGNSGCNVVASVFNALCEATLPQHEVAMIVKRWSTAFLLTYVALDKRYETLLDPALDRNPNVTTIRGGPGEAAGVLPTPIPHP